eukprot:TRINITY_DN43643_c0_g1_i1.p1 TRINITY_DN43643_c0_g1~~TRINITY_DN43643_c0_g1_i1.p1  ORF type:complete len:261 (-),score=24.84 TRINITY_DN43643_c0_g1_i1:296-1012(-)
MSGQMNGFYRNFNVDTVLYQLRASGNQREAVDIDSTYYLVNPEGDLVSAQKMFLQHFENNKTWDGDVGAPCPPAEYLLQQLKTHQLFLYIGHGSGRKYMSMNRVSQLRQGPHCLLMGCGSVGLCEQGDYHPTAAIFAYISAGCPFVIGNLWDVSDNDINRYSIELLRSWTNKKGDGLHCFSDVADEVAKSRQVCKLQYLTAGAVVVIGIPSSIIGRLTALLFVLLLQCTLHKKILTCM